jgi:hypothetical protein
MIQLQLTNVKRSYSPGEVIEVRIKWDVSKPADRFDVELSWATRGKGTVDEEIAASAVVVAGGRTSGEGSFRITAPNGPYSFSGRLVSLVWILAASSVDGKESSEEHVLIAPGGQELLVYTHAGSQK